MKFIVTPIGIIETPFENLEGMPIQPSGAENVTGKVILKEEYTQGLKDLDGFSHIILLYSFHRSRGYNLMVTPFLDDQKRGLFSTRAPRRPNSIGLSIVELIKIERNKIMIKGIDVLNQTPLLDIKPYVPEFDTKNVTSVGWLEKGRKRVSVLKSDDRFI